MRNSFKFLTSVFIVLVITLCFSTVVFAASSDGLNVTISSDKETYSANETAKITVTVENTNPFEVKNVTIEHIVPDGLKQIGLSSLRETRDFMANEKIEFEVDVTTDHPGETSTSLPTNPDNPKTGNTSNFFLIVCLITVSIGALFLCVRYNKKLSRMFCLVLCLALVMPMLSSNVLALENTDIKSFETVKDIIVDGKSYDYKVVVSYTAFGEVGGGDEEKKVPTAALATAKGSVVYLLYAQKNMDNEYYSAGLIYFTPLVGLAALDRDNVTKDIYDKWFTIIEDANRQGQTVQELFENKVLREEYINDFDLPFDEEDVTNFLTCYQYWGKSEDITLANSKEGGHVYTLFAIKNTQDEFYTIGLSRNLMGYEAEYANMQVTKDIYAKWFTIIEDAGKTDKTVQGFFADKQLREEFINDVGCSEKDIEVILGVTF